ncbi:SulP family inorganic anion transporter [Pelagibacterium limicola]|uniref:SulP family inorganic anion transporter n=1 Tax=Pelagibacterium limicola TaxID=2791022 RepID=UPI0018B00C93|nr:SulP family inorganic anion transporter [Pelagibacterium limicola]
MTSTSHRPVAADKPSFIEEFTPKSLTTLREGYGFTQLRADAIAGLTVAIVALPLSMAIAIASGVTPDRGLYAAIVGGFLVSLFGGSRFQIGGPAGAFIVLVSATVARHGVDGLLLATALSGVLMIGIGLLRLGTFIKFIPYPVTVGFTAGIAIIILASQLRDLFGLTLDGREPGEIVEKLHVLWVALPTMNGVAVAVGFGTIAMILALNRFAPRLPALLIAVAATALIAGLFGLPVATIGSQFGGIPNALPVPALPEISGERIIAVLPDAIAFALLGAIESLLSAVVADGMTGRRHRSNSELLGQGIANIGSALFGGICVTGTIARTATNVRSGGRTPVSGMLHALFLLGFVMVAAPLASYIPLAALAGVLVVVAWNMIERHAISALFRGSRGDAAVLAVTFLLVVFRDLTEGIVVGFALGALLFIHRMAAAVAIEERKATHTHPETDDKSPYDPRQATDNATVVYKISGAFFFGAAASVGAILDRIADQRKNFVLDCTDLPVLDSTAAHALEGAARKARQSGIRFIIAGARAPIRRMLLTHGVRPPMVKYKPDVASALAFLDKDGG